MRKTFGKALGIALIFILTLGSITGCNNDPTSTAEFLERYEALENRENYTFEETFEVTVGDGQAFKYVTSGDVTAEASHMTTSGTLFGYDATSERYVEAKDDTYVQYRSIEVMGTSIWARSEYDAISPVSAFTKHELLEHGTFAATEDGYTLTIPGSDFATTYLGTLDETFPDLTQGTNSSSLLGALQSSDAVYTFDKNYELTGISYPATATGDGATNTSVDGNSYTISLAYTIGNYGTVDANSVTVPSNVKNSAIDIKEALAKAKELAAQALDTIEGTADGLADLAREGLDELNSRLEDIDVSGLIDQVTNVVSDAA